METNPTVFVIDDNPGALRSAQWLLESYGLNVETYWTTAEFLDSYDPDRPGCLVLDVHMPGMGGLELQERLIASGTCPPIIFVTGGGEVPTSVRAMRLGAVDFLEKPVNGEELVSLVREAIAKDERRCHLDRQRREVESRVDRLTMREREVMNGLLQGKPAKAVAADLGIAHKTTLKHRTRVLRKLDARSEAELLRRFFDHSLDLQDSPVTPQRVRIDLPDPVRRPLGKALTPPA